MSLPSSFRQTGHAAWQRRFRMLGMVLSLAAAFPAHVEAGVAPALLLARSYDANVDVQRYWVSEKLDGIRAFWDGAQLLSRGGQQIHAPQWFIDGLPAQALDGELWMGRGHFDALSGTVRRAQPDEQAWRSVRFMIYEAPGAVGTFTERLQVIRERVALANGLANIPWLQAVEQFRVSDSRALQEQLQQITRAGGEGLMLHRADALYETGRSDALMKLKLWQDAEATIIGHQPGRGKYQGMLGALRVRSADGREFSLGSGLSDQQRRDPPPVGTVITYRFNDRTAKGQPRFARFWRISETAFDLAAER